MALVRHHGSVSSGREDLGTQSDPPWIVKYAANAAISQTLVNDIPTKATIGAGGASARFGVQAAYQCCLRVDAKVSASGACGGIPVNRSKG